MSTQQNLGTQKQGTTTNRGETHFGNETQRKGRLHSLLMVLANDIETVA